MKPAFMNVNFVAVSEVGEGTISLPRTPCLYVMNQIILQCNMDMVKMEPDSDSLGHLPSEGQLKGGKYSDGHLSASYPQQQKELNVRLSFVHISGLFSSL
jgi:hypothetical protein